MRGILCFLGLILIIGCFVKNKIPENNSANKTFFKIHSSNDSVLLGHTYSCRIEIDREFLKMINEIEVLCNDIPLKMCENSFEFSLITVRPGQNNINLIIITHDKRHTDTTKVQCSFVGKYPEHTEQIESLPIAEVMPIFDSNEFVSFDEYMLVNLKKEGLNLEGKLVIVYSIMKNGNVRVDNIKNSGLTKFDSEKIRKIVLDSGKWTPGQDKGREVNVTLTSIYTFE